MDKGIVSFFFFFFRQWSWHESNWREGNPRHRRAAWSICDAYLQRRSSRVTWRDQRRYTPHPSLHLVFTYLEPILPVSPEYISFMSCWKTGCYSVVLFYCNFLFYIPLYMSGNNGILYCSFPLLVMSLPLLWDEALDSVFNEQLLLQKQEWVSFNCRGSSSGVEWSPPYRKDIFRSADAGFPNWRRGWIGSEEVSTSLCCLHPWSLPPIHRNCEHIIDIPHILTDCQMYVSVLQKPWTQILCYCQHVMNSFMVFLDMTSCSLIDRNQDSYETSRPT